MFGDLTMLITLAPTKYNGINEFIFFIIPDSKSDLNIAALGWMEVDNAPPQVYQYISEKKDIKEALKCEKILYPDGSIHVSVKCVVQFTKSFSLEMKER
ncbi:hypothetical protein AVEN_157145-1 [Araneus ventricosus]|uniref:Uncharacterized protein n=1 Tax=Araneus ventricosus TaxID=182803 RepID=A0A4Y2M474_ARAVE|nr:hypothetical protein AVEN_157145-1 [Araneus ventricosus]